MSFLKKIISKPKVPVGRYTYRGEDKFAGMSLQLRIEQSGQGVMVINANTVLHLNQTATSFAYYFMQGLPEKEALSKIRRQFRVKTETAKADYKNLIYTISTLAQTEKIDPISFLDIEKEEPFTYNYTAPLRMDIALTFRCQNDCGHCYAGGPHETPELTTTQWKNVIDKLWEIGVFILTFTGGEPTLREDLPKLLLYAQGKGMVTGLISNGRRLKDKEYVDLLEKSGLDFVQITLESHKPQVHDKMTGAKGSWKETVAGIRNATQSQIYVSTNTTLSKQNSDDFLTTIDYIKGLGVNAFGCNSLIYSGRASDASEEFALTTDDLNSLLPKIREKAQMIGLKFLWYTPTQYCQFDPVKLGLGVKACTAAMINACVGPNGDVYPCQSY
ncbi:MAG: radical SAM protein, partial [Ignavibacteria bacterium]